MQNLRTVDDSISFAASMLQIITRMAWPSLQGHSLLCLDVGIHCIVKQFSHGSEGPSVRGGVRVQKLGVDLAVFHAGIRSRRRQHDALFGQGYARMLEGTGWGPRKPCAVLRQCVRLSQGKSQ